MASLSYFESKVWHTHSRNHKLRKARSKAADATKMSQTTNTEAIVFFPPPGLAAPPGLSSAGFKSPLDLALHSFGLPSGSDHYVDSDDEATSVGTGSNSVFGSSDGEKDTEPTARMRANAPLFVPEYLSDLQAAAAQLSISDSLQAAAPHTPLVTTCRKQKTPLRKGAGLFVPMLSPYEVAGMSLPADSTFSEKC